MTTNKPFTLLCSIIHQLVKMKVYHDVSKSLSKLSIHLKRSTCISFCWFH